MGQTPLHFSVDWPEALHLLLDVGAAVDLPDHHGLTPIFYAAERRCLDSIQILTEAGCALHKISTFYVERSLLEHLTLTNVDLVPDEILEKLDAAEVFGAIVRLVAQRRDTLAALARASLDSIDLAQLDLSAETLLDCKASIAISMLQERLKVPKMLLGLTPEKCSVYHLRDMDVRKAQALWDAGFRDINELDSLGRCPLMTRIVFNLETSRRPKDMRSGADFAIWLWLKGADLHCRQRHVFQRRVALHRGYLETRSMTDRPSHTTALHYLGAFWGNRVLSKVEHKKGPDLVNTDTSGLVRIVLSDPLSDCCDCPCSLGGCKAFTMMIKAQARRAQTPFQFRLRTAVRDKTQVIAHLIDMDCPDFAWLRHEMLRYMTFKKLRLRHTCCRPCTLELEFSYTKVIAGFDDDERREIMEEQEQQTKKLETLVKEFENKYGELGVPFVDFLEGYWRNRMREVLQEEVPIDEAGLERIGVRLRRTSSVSSLSSWDEEERCEEVDSGDADETGEGRTRAVERYYQMPPGSQGLRLRLSPCCIHDGRHDYPYIHVFDCKLTISVNIGVLCCQFRRI